MSSEKCSRVSKHDASGEGTGIPHGDSKHKEDRSSMNGSISGEVPGETPSINGVEQDGYSSVSGSRRSLRSTEGDVMVNGDDGDGLSLSSRSSRGGGGDHGSIASQQQPQRPRTSVHGRRRAGSAKSSRSGRPGSAEGSRSISSRRSYDDDGDFDDEVASFTDNNNTDFSQYVDVVRQESSRLSQHEDLNPAPLDMSLLHSVLGDLNLSLKDSEARSLRIYEDIEEVRAATMELKRTIVGRLVGSAEEEEEANVQQNGPSPKETSRALATARAAKAALAELALEVAEASKMAAEAEKAAAEAAALADDTAHEVDKADEKLKEFEDTENERKQKAEEEATKQAEEEAKQAAKKAEEEANKGKEEVYQQDEEEHTKPDEKKVESDEENKKDALKEKQQEKKSKTIASPRKAKENPLEWPHYPLNIVQSGDDNDDDEDIGCILRYKRENFPSASSSPKFECSLITEPSPTLLSDSEELISDVISLERVDEDGEDKLGTHIVVAIPYTTNTRMAATREFVVKLKCRGGDEDDWKVIQALSTEGSYKELKAPFIECKVSRIGIFAVVARLTQDRLTISKKGGVVKSSTDNRMTVTYPPKACTLISVTLRIQPAESVVTELKERLRHCSDLIAASPIIHLTHSSKKAFEKPVTLSIPCPPNPHKATATPDSGRNSGGSGGRSERQAMQPLREEGAVVIRATKSSIFGGDPTSDSLHVLFKQGNSAVWNEMEDVEIKQVRKDVVAVEIDHPVDKLVVLRMTAEPRYPILNITQTFEKALQIKYANIILQHREDDPQQVAVLCVPSKQVDGALRRLGNDGFEAQSDPSADIPMTEGQEITLRFTGNIKIVGQEELKFTFHSYKRSLVELSITESNRFGNYSSPEYRGVAEFYGEPRIKLEDMEDPEEILLREAEAKAAEKEAKEERDDKKGKVQKAKENKDQIINQTSQSLLCKIPVTLPKAEPDPPLPPSRYRTTAIDVGGMVSNSNLKWLSTELGNEWESLAAYLGIKRSRLQSIKRNNPAKQEQQVLDMLITWRSQVPKSYDKERKICSALTRCGRYDLAEELKYRGEEFEENNED